MMAMENLNLLPTMYEICLMKKITFKKNVSYNTFYITVFLSGNKSPYYLRVAN